MSLLTIPLHPLPAVAERRLVRLLGPEEWTDEERKRVLHQEACRAYRDRNAEKCRAAVQASKAKRAA